MSFLQELVGQNSSEGSVAVYNQNFFSAYIDPSVLAHLLEVSNHYHTLLYTLKERHNKTEEKIYENALRELETCQKKIESLKHEQIKHSNDAISLNLVRAQEYQMETVNFADLHKVVNASSKMMVLLAENDQKLELEMRKAEELSKEKQPIEEKRKKLDDALKEQVVALEKTLETLEGQDFSCFNVFQSRDIVEKYREGLKEVIGNERAVQAYTGYFFNMIRKEAELLKVTYQTAKEYHGRASEETNYEVPELQSKNQQIVFQNQLVRQIDGKISDFANVWCRRTDEKDTLITSIANDYITAQTFMDSMYRYTGNLEVYQDNPELRTQHKQWLYNVYENVTELIGSAKKNEIHTVGDLVAKVAGKPVSHSNRNMALESFQQIFQDFNETDEEFNFTSVPEKEKIVPVEMQRAGFTR